jgi:voltage-gated potassium channel
MQELDRHAFRYLISSAILILAIGTVFYHIVEKLSWVNAYYFCVVTLSTVGYGDIVPHTDAGKIFTTFYILTGVGIITTFFSVIIRRRAQKIENKSKMKDK